MSFDYFTLSQLASELHQLLTGKIITGAVFSEKNLKLTIHQLGSICFQCKPNGLILYNRNDKRKLPRPGNRDPERYFIDARIIHIGIPGRDRSLVFSIERYNKKLDETTRGSLVCEMMNRRIDCALISQESEKIIGCWGNEKRLVAGNLYIPPAKDQRRSFGLDSIEMRGGLDGSQDENYLDFIRRTFSGIDRSVIREILYRCNLREKDLVSPLGIEKFWENGLELINSIGSLGGFVYEEQGKLQFTCLYPTRLPSSVRVEKRALLVDSIYDYSDRQNIYSAFERKKKHINRIIKKIKKSSTKKRDILHKEFMETESAQDLERKGHTLLANLGHIEKYSKRVCLMDVFEDSKKIMIEYKFEDDQTPSEHAERLLKFSKKLKRRRKVLPSLISKLDEEIVELESYEKLLDSENPNLDKLTYWLTEKGYMDLKNNVGNEHKRRADNSASPRKYLTDDGWMIMAGKNNKENDILTHRVAAQNDFWFHAHGYSGSHVILKRDGRKDEPSKLSIEQAAAVAAFWSKGKTAKKVPVVYTLKKYVNKPKGGAPGQAILKREKTIVVQPRVPDRKA